MAVQLLQWGSCLPLYCIDGVGGDVNPMPVERRVPEKFNV